MNDSQLLQALRALDGPVEPDAAFRDSLFARLQAERSSGRARHRRPTVIGRLAPSLRLSVALLLLLAALLAVGLAAGAIWRLLPAPASVLYVGAGDGLYLTEGEYRDLRPLRDDGAYLNPRVSASGRYVAAGLFVWPDHQGLRILTHEGEVVGMAGGGAHAWSPVRDELALRLEQRSQIVIVQPDGSITRTIDAPEDVARGLQASLTWTRDGKQLTISGATRMGEGWSGGLWLVDPSTNRWLRVLDLPDRLVEGISWSPDGTRLAYVARRPGADVGTLWTVNPDGDDSRRLGETEFPSWQIDWSPDGERLVFAGTIDGQSDIFSIRADGSDLQRLTTDPLDDRNPQWSPDGQSIVFHRDDVDYPTERQRRYGIWVMNSDGSDQRLIIEDFRGAGWGVTP